MGIFDRFSRLVKSNLNSAIDKVSDPGKEIDQLVIEMEEHQRKARAEVQGILAHEKRERQRKETLERSVVEWGERAERALRAGDEGLAKQALERKLSLEGELRDAESACTAARAQVDEMTAQLKALDQKVKEVKLRKETLKAQARAQKSRHAGTGDLSAFDKFDQLVTDVDVKEAEVQLDDELAAVRHEDAKSKEVERKLADLEKGTDLDDRLAALKAKLDKKE